MEEKIQEMQDVLDKMGAAAPARRVDAEASNGTMADFGAMAQGGEGLSGSLSDIQEAHDSMSETVDQLNDVLIAIPPMFDEAEGNYLTAIDDRADDIQATYQRTLNNGFKGMAFFVAACSVVGLLLLHARRRRTHARPARQQLLRHSERLATHANATDDLVGDLS